MILHLNLWIMNFGSVCPIFSDTKRLLQLLMHTAMLLYICIYSRDYQAAKVLFCLIYTESHTCSHSPHTSTHTHTHTHTHMPSPHSIHHQLFLALHRKKVPLIFILNFKFTSVAVTGFRGPWWQRLQCNWLEILQLFCAAV